MRGYGETIIHSPHEFVSVRPKIVASPQPGIYRYLLGNSTVKVGRVAENNSVAWSGFCQVIQSFRM